CADLFVQQHDGRIFDSSALGRVELPEQRSYNYRSYRTYSRDHLHHETLGRLRIGRETMPFAPKPMLDDEEEKKNQGGGVNISGTPGPDVGTGVPGQEALG